MNSLGYDPTSPESILQFAKRLTGRTLAEVVDMSGVIENHHHKGDLGSMVEKFYFRIATNSLSEPDFPESGVELKTTGVKRNSKGEFQAKERLVLKMIDYVGLVDEQWESSSLMEKCGLMLLLFSLYEVDVAVFNRRFVIDPILFTFPEDDLVQIRLDWLTIKDKIQRGLAHELSEGDTYYLGACRKGSGGEKERLRRQPNSNVLARSRAFALKIKYVNKIIEDGALRTGTLGLTGTHGIVDATKAKFEPFLNRTVDEISAQFNFYKKGTNDKSFFHDLVFRILGSGGRSVPELDKSGVEVKTIRVNRDWKPFEAMSFPGFKYMDIVAEDWEDSVFHEKLEQKFLFVIFRDSGDGVLRLEKVGYWNMPYRDREEARRVWEETKRRVQLDARDLPKSSESHVAHVRPKARDSRDTLPTPQGIDLVKKCFWLNREYVFQVVQDL